MSHKRNIPYARFSNQINAMTLKGLEINEKWAEIRQQTDQNNACFNLSSWCEIHQLHVYYFCPNCNTDLRNSMPGN